MDGLNYDLSEFTVEAVSDDEALVLRREIDDIFPAQSEGYDHVSSHVFEVLDPRDPADATAAASHSLPRSPSLRAYGGFSSSTTRHDGDQLRGGTPQVGDELINVEDDDDDDNVCVGGKRHGENLVNSSPKHQRISTSALPAPPLSGFLPYAGHASSLLGGSGEPVSSSMSLLADSNTSALTSSLASELPSSQFGICSSVIIDGHLEPLSSESLDYLDGVGKAIVTGESSRGKQPFMSERAGSAPVPTVVTDFNKGLGHHIYVPRSVIRLKDDGRDPIQARDLVDSMIAPLLAAESSHRTLEELVDSYDLHAYMAATSGALLRRRTLGEIQELNQVIGRLRSELSSSHTNLKLVDKKLDEEISMSGSLREENKRVIEECLTLKNNLNVLAREKEDMSDKFSKLSDEMNVKDIVLARKEKELEDLRAELLRERQEKEGLIASAERGDAFIDSFPDLFRRLLDHPHFRVSFDAFNNAAAQFGEFRASRSLQKFIKDNPGDKLPTYHSQAVGQLKAADEAWKAKSFPIVDEIPSMITSGTTVADLLERIASAASASAAPAASASASSSASASAASALP